MFKLRLFKALVLMIGACSLVGCNPEVVDVPAINLEVVVASKPAWMTRYAANEMTNILYRMSGIAVPIVAKPTEGKYSIILGCNEWSDAHGLRPETLPRDSFCVKIDKEATFICGCDDGIQRATLYGVYGFLDKHAGVRFYFPGELGTVVPMACGLRLPVCRYSVTPRFSCRDCYLNGAGPYPGIDPEDKKAQNTAKNVYRYLLRESSERIGCCHGQNSFKIAERFSLTHPEYFQLRKDGTRCTGTVFRSNWMGRQLCHTSKVWDIFRAETLERIRKGKRWVDIMPQDGMQACRCDECQRVFNTTNFTLSSGYATELIWSNTVSIANAITAAGLEGGVSQMAYGTFRNIPSVEIPNNVAVVLAVGGPWAESRPNIRDKQIEFVQKWAEKLKRPVTWLWTYPMKNYGRLQAKDVPQVAPRAFANFYTLVEPYIDGSFVESNVGETLVQNYLNFYVFSKLAWDGKIDIEEVLSEHHRLMFGAGASDMADFFDELEKKWIGEMAIPSLIGETEIGPMLYAPKENQIWSEIYTRQFIDGLRKKLASAASKVSPDSLEAKRIAWIKEELFDRMDKHSIEFHKAK